MKQSLPFLELTNGHLCTSAINVLNENPMESTFALINIIITRKTDRKEIIFLCFWEKYDKRDNFFLFLFSILFTMKCFRVGQKTR